MSVNSLKTADLVTFTEEILNGKLIFCAVQVRIQKNIYRAITPYLKPLKVSQHFPDGFVTLFFVTRKTVHLVVLKSVSLYCVSLSWCLSNAFNLDIIKYF